MLDHISTLDQLEVEATQIDEYLKITCSDDPGEAVEVGNNLVVYLARTGKMLADAKYHQDDAVKNTTLVEIGMKRNLSPTIMKKLIEASTKRENYLVNWIERLNRSCTHKIEWLRTLISKAKEEMKYQNFTNSNQ